jgi:hypothetical protein
MPTPSAAATADMLRECDAYMVELVDQGAAEAVAVDRTWDAFSHAITSSTERCFDKRDRLFENRLRTIAEKGTDNG